MDRLILVLLLGGCGHLLFANNITVSEVTLLTRDADAGTLDLGFNLGWDNSWRTTDVPFNWDAAWVFIKYRVDEGDWHHASLHELAAAPASCTVTITPDSVGAFVYRASAGAGTVQYDSLVLAWDYRLDGVDAGAQVSVQVFADEMIYVPEGQYALGSGGEQGSEFYQSILFSPTRNPYVVADESPISKGTGGALSDPNILAMGAPIPASFPKGFQSFYCMKYETSQRQFVSFYNTLSETQKEGLNISHLDSRMLGSPVARNGMAWDADGEMATTAPCIPVSSLSLTQVLAYLDWSGLRPMTELEFEKACRGTATPLEQEYAWGTASVSTLPYAIAEPYAESEWVTNPDSLTTQRGNGLFNGNTSMGGPLRSGIFAASVGENTRAWSGGSYYGIMELSGNLSETVVSVSNAEGRSFTADHGDGDLDEDGSTDAPWPVSMDAFAIRGDPTPPARSPCRCPTGPPPRCPPWRRSLLDFVAFAPIIDDDLFPALPTFRSPNRTPDFALTPTHPPTRCAPSGYASADQHLPGGRRGRR